MPAGNSVCCRPSAPLAPAARYQARVVGAMSYLGDRLTTPFHWTFETYDPTPPTVTETTPLADAIDVEPGTAVQVIFDRPLLVGGEGASFALEGPAGPVASTLRWIPADERPDPLLQGRGMNTAGRSQAFVGLELRPLRPLQASTLYTATVKGVQNASGLPMAGEHSWQFRTKNGAVVQNVMPVETSYYTFGSQRVALRISGDPDPERNGLFYIHTDHLGSTSLLSYGQGHAQAGEEVPGSRAAHLPFGEHRVEPEAGLSDRGFTGHRELGGIGLVHMRARLYSAELGRFVSPDILIPDPADPQSYNRYAYVLNNPLRFTDPSGHCAADDDECWAVAAQLYQQYGWLIEGVWTIDQVRLFLQAGDAIAAWFHRNGGGDAAARVRSAFGGTTFAHADVVGKYILPLVMLDGTPRHHVRGATIYLLDRFDLKTLVHELGHVLDNRTGFGFPIGSAFWFGGGAADDLAYGLGADLCRLRCACKGYRTPNERTLFGYAERGPSEDFAVSFAESVLNPTGFESDHPIRASLLNQLASSLVTEMSEFASYRPYLERRKAPAPVPTPPAQ